MTEPLLSEERIQQLARFAMIALIIDDCIDNTATQIRQAVRETAVACAAIADEVGQTRLAEFHDAPRMADGIAAEIRRRMDE